jgi:hypothetical protein
MTVAARTSNKPHQPAARGMARSRANWNDKLRPALVPRVVDDPKRGDKLLIATPLLLAEEIARTPRGAVITLSELRERLAKRFDADRTCPLTTGIFAAILAGAVGDDILHERKPRWPIWRLVKDDGSLNPNWPLDARYRAALLREEGLRVTWMRTGWKVLF